MSYSSIIVPSAARGHVSRQTNLGVHTYDMDELYSPDSAIWKSKVLDLVSPKYPPQQATAPTQYWFDRSRYNNHGTINGATWKQQPSGIWALSFDDSDDWVSLPVSSTLTSPTQGTLIIWFKPASVTGLQRSPFAMGDKDTTNVDEIHLQASGTTLYWRTRTGSVTTQELYPNTVLNVSTWYCVAVASTGTATEMDVNGVAKTLTVNDGSNNGDWFGDIANIDFVSLGSLRRPTSDFWGGLIDRVTLFDSFWPHSIRRGIYLATMPGHMRG